MSIRLGVIGGIAATALLIYVLASNANEEVSLFPAAQVDEKQRNIAEIGPSFSTNAPIDAQDAAPAEEANELNKLDSEVISLIQSKNVTRSTKFDTLWTAYTKNRAARQLAAYYIDSMQALTPLSEEEIRKLISELNQSTLSPELKAHFIRLLANAAVSDEASAPNTPKPKRELILATIKASSSDPNAFVAKEAILAFTRIAPLEEASYALGDAYRRNILSEAEYIRESAFKLPEIKDPRQQESALAGLATLSQHSKNPESREALLRSIALMLENPQISEHLGSESRRSLAEYFKANEPAVLFSSTDYDMAKAVQYNNWLHGLANLNGRTIEERTNFVLNIATDETTDSGKIVALLISPQGHEKVSAARRSGKLKVLQNRLQAEIPKLAPTSATYSIYQAALEVLN
ncbi:MAG TPA: hypothetical protein VEC06_16380 [Paucimonas sp.]|nr:hypothetical protein [Paucimonas sp.]